VLPVARGWIYLNFSVDTGLDSYTHGKLSTDNSQGEVTLGFSWKRPIHEQTIPRFMGQIVSTTTLRERNMDFWHRI
jgi:hypothetical protein